MKSFKVLFVLAAFTLLTIPGCEMPNDNSSSSPATGSVSGKAYLLSRSDHAGIVVTLEKTDGLHSVAAITQARSIAAGGRSADTSSSLASAQTDSDGSYTFDKVVPGVYTIYAWHPDSGGKAVAINDVVVEAGKSSIAAALSLTLTGSIEGRIRLDNNTTGNSGFLVCVAGTSYMAVTADDGSFSISGIPEGDGYVIIIMKGSYTSLWAGVTASASVKGGENTSLTPNPRAIASTDISGADGEGGGLIWQGEYSNLEALIAAKGQPQRNWAYFNSTTRTSYIWTGTRWDTLGGDFNVRNIFMYTIIFENNGGVPAPESPVSLARDSTLSLPTGGMLKRGYDFAGWYTDPDFAVLAAFPITVIRNISLYARWVERADFNFYAVRFESNGGSQVADQRVAEGSTVVRPANPAKSGYTFNGWYADAGLNTIYDFSTPVTGHIALYAKWNYSSGIIFNEEEIGPYLDGQAGGASLNNPITLPLSMQLTEARWLAILSAVSSRGKYVTLDLSACTRSGDNTGGGLRSDGTFDPLSTTNNPYVASLILPNMATNIQAGTWGASAFSGLVNIRTISGNNIMDIEDYTFYGCTNLTSVIFPEVTNVGDYVFVNCTSLGSIIFPKVTDIGEHSFAGCTSLTGVSFPLANSIGSGAFYDCSSLEDVYFPIATDIGSYAFYGCETLLGYGRQRVDIPEATSIGEYAFAGCTSLERLRFHNVNYIGEYAFSDCNYLDTVEIGEGCSLVYDPMVPIYSVSLEFDDYYYYRSQQAGIYTWDGYEWRHERFRD